MGGSPHAHTLPGRPDRRDPQGEPRDPDERPGSRPPCRRTLPGGLRGETEDPRFASDADLLQQIVAEIGAQRAQIANKEVAIRWQDRPRPRVYWYDPPERASSGARAVPEGAGSGAREEGPTSAGRLAEADLYPVLIRWLHDEHGLSAMRIDEKRSGNTRESGSNKWLHPDVVALEPLSTGWNRTVADCVHGGGGRAMRLWSFEAKLRLTRSNVRECFFQAVSNSSWANEGYLVATAVDERDDVEKELRTLAGLHGIGVIVLDPQDPSQSEIVVPARARQEVDWNSVDRLARENPDFQNFVENVSDFLQTGRVRGFPGSADP